MRMERYKKIFNEDFSLIKEMNKVKKLIDELGKKEKIDGFHIQGKGIHSIGFSVDMNKYDNSLKIGYASSHHQKEKDIRKMENILFDYLKKLYPQATEDTKYHELIIEFEKDE